jgi:hypothetical protein
MQRRNPCDSDTGRSVAPIDHLQSLLLDTCINHDSIKVEIFRGADPRQIPASKSSNYHRQSSMAVGHLFHSSILCRYRHQALFSRHRTINNTFHYSSTTLSTINTTTVLQERRRRSTNLLYSSPDLNRPSGYLLSV